MENKIEEKPSVAICGGSVVIFAGLYRSKLKFIFFVFNVCCCLVFPDLQVQNHFFFYVYVCCCCLSSLNSVFKVKLMVYYLKIDHLL